MGYLVSENNLFVDEFAVSVACNKGYEGTAVATACSKHLGTFSLSGCTPARYCKAPANIEGYTVTETKLDIANFDVAVSCASGFAQDATPKAVACSGHNQAYSLQGCSKLKHCLAPDDATGYLVEEKDLLAHKFKVNAKCAPGYAGEPVVEVCKTDFGQYTLTGCTKQ